MQREEKIEADNRPFKGCHVLLSLEITYNTTGTTESGEPLCYQLVKNTKRNSGEIIKERKNKDY